MKVGFSNMNIKRFIKITLGIIVIIFTLLLAYRVYRYQHVYCQTIGRYAITTEGPAIKAYKGDYFSPGYRDFFIYLYPDDESMFEKLESGDIIYLIHSDVIEMNKYTSKPYYYVKINKWLYNLFTG